jgi:predicted nucleic acid-binding protein
VILADTSIWIDYFNGIESIETDNLDSALKDGTVAMGDLIFLEILQGFRDDKEFIKAKKTLATLDQYELFGAHMVEKCADNYRFLRKKELTVRKTIDLIIATFCIETKIQLLFSDKDYVPFVEFLKLDKFRENT